MALKLAERFRDSEGAPIEVHGELVHMIYELPPIRDKMDLRIELTSSSNRPQALRLKARGGQVFLNRQLVDDLVLWSDTTPPAMTATLIPRAGGGPMSVRAWNAWRDEGGTMQAWVGNSGMLVERRADGSLVLRCSDGYDEPTFDDLLVRLALSRSEGISEETTV